MKRKGLMLLILLGAMFTSCNLQENTTSYYTLTTRSFNIGYCGIKSISAQFLDSLDAILMCRTIDGNKLYYFNSEDASLNAMYDSLCTKYVDTSYNKTRTYNYDELSPVFMAEEFSKINVTSKSNYDDSHPANSDMGDIVTVNTCSEYPFISSNYTKTHDWSDIDGDDIWGRWYSSTILIDKYQSPVLELINNIGEHDLAIIGGKVYYGSNMPFCILHFISKPTSSKNQSFEIKFVTDSGEEYSCSANCTFE
ncbi:MAG: hypothetical protein LKK19_04120 [Bacteroidales bacterium]|jgi:hypothetical protein|nr:hypothetical protein [Bacteroidales bacterium]MCI2121870.1 hypothetical protein [Bacteroidales bacterium]MCI2145712.1 hypothetical protein [Bacteroidales bacterium]